MTNILDWLNTWKGESCTGGGGADGLKTAKVTLTLNAGTGGGGLDGGVQGNQEGFVFLSQNGVTTVVGTTAGNTVEATAILVDMDGRYGAYYGIGGDSPVVTGSAELSEHGDVILVTGDCTLTMDPVN